MAESHGFRRVAPICSAVLFALVAAGPGGAGADAGNPLTDLIDAAARRLQLAEPVAAVKWHTGTAVEDPARVDEELAGLAADATAEDLDPAYVRRVFTDQIAATEAIEYHRFARWKLEPESAPPAPPDLSASRAAIDDLNGAMMTQIGQQWAVLQSASCGGLRDEAEARAAMAYQFDAFDRRALTVATRSYCSR